MTGFPTTAPLRLLAMATLLFAASIAGASPSDAADSRPNFLLILADDMGFSDLGAFGGEISTPNLDQLATTGLRMTNFHTTPTCSPTRAELLTGVDHHRAGLANMAELITDRQRGQPGYLGHLDERVPTLAERLSETGYRTVMSGKWHLGTAPEHDPANRGFQQVFALLDGGHNHFGKPGLPPASMGGAHYTEQGKAVAVPGDFYSSDYFTDRLLDFLSREGDARPFFAYLPFTAPHWPLQAPAENIAHYKGKYDAGWDVLRRQRLQRQRELGLLPANTPDSAPDTLRAWDSLGPRQQREQSRKMEIYAAMVERLDWNVGRVIDYLKQSGQFENTVIVFLSDNGAAPDTLGNMAKKVPGFPPIDEGSPESWGGPDSMLSYGPNWAQAASTPRRLYKSVITEGGLVTPLILHYAGFARKGDISDTFASVRDIAPTLLGLAAALPGEDDDATQLEGATMLPYLTGDTDRIHPEGKVFGWELFGQRAVRRDEWKLVHVSEPNGSGQWELYNLLADPTERRDRSADQPGIYQELLEAWAEYKTRMHIIIEEQVVSPHTAL